MPTEEAGNRPDRDPPAPIRRPPLVVLCCEDQAPWSTRCRSCTWASEPASSVGNALRAFAAHRC